MAKTYWRSTKPLSLPWNQKMAPMWGMFRRNSFWASDDLGVTIFNLRSCESVSEAKEDGREGHLECRTTVVIRFDLWIRCVALCVTCDFFSTTHTTHTDRQTDILGFLYSSQVTFSVYLTVKKWKIKKTTVHRQLHMSALGSVFSFTVQLFYSKRLIQGIERFLST